MTDSTVVAPSTAQFANLPNAAECWSTARLDIIMYTRVIEWAGPRPALFNTEPETFVANQHHDGSTASRITNLARLWDDIYSAHTLAEGMNAPTLTLRVEPITGEIDLANRNAQANALMAMRTREATAQARVEVVLVELVEARERAERAERTARELRTEQITDGGDERLIEFWSIAESNATEANFCSEYDRMAAMMNGPGRSRDFSVSGTITVTFQFSDTVTASSEDEARDEVEGRDFSDWRGVIENGSSWNADIDSIDVNGVSAD